MLITLSQIRLKQYPFNFNLLSLYLETTKLGFRALFKEQNCTVMSKIDSCIFTHYESWLWYVHSLQEDPPTGVSGAPTDNNIMIWNAVIFGPHDTPFEDGTFKLTIEFTEEYPNKPPTVRFVSKMFHPNVYADGGICLDILQNRWSPTYDVSAILTSIQVNTHNPYLFEMTSIHLIIDRAIICNKLFFMYYNNTHFLYCF